MTEEELRAEFEQRSAAPPYERDISRKPEDSAWPGQYQDLCVQLAWDLVLDIHKSQQIPEVDAWESKKKQLG